MAYVERTDVRPGVRLLSKCFCDGIVKSILIATNKRRCIREEGGKV